MSIDEYVCVCGQYFSWDDGGADWLVCPECGSGDVLIATRGRTSGSEPPPKPDPPPSEVAKPHDTESRPLQDLTRGLNLLPPGYAFTRPPRPPDIAILRPGTPCEIGPTDDPLTGTVSAVSIYPNDRIAIQVAWWSGRTHYEKWLESHEVRECVDSRRCTVGLARAVLAERAKEREAAT